MTTDRILTLIDDAAVAFCCRYWTHERTDSQHRIMRDQHGLAIYCEGGDPDGCTTCDRALRDARAAERHGELAAVALAAGDMDEALRHALAARSREDNWEGGAAYGPVVDAIEALIDAE